MAARSLIASFGGFFQLALPALLNYHRRWTGGRVVECTALEMRRTCKGTVSSNLTLSATKIDKYLI